MISTNKFKRRILTVKEVEKMGYHPYERNLAQIEDLLCMRKSSDKHLSHSDPSKTPQPQLWNEAVTYLDLGKYNKYVLTRYWTSEISSDCENGSDVEIVNSRKIGCRQQKEVPKAWLDMLDKSNMFPQGGAHLIHGLYGLKEFVVMSSSRRNISLQYGESLLKKLYDVAIKCQCQIPMFIECSTTEYRGFLECPDFRTIFEVWSLNKRNHFNMNNIYSSIKWNLFRERYKFKAPAVVTTMSYCIDIKESCKGLNLTNEEYEDDWCDNNITFHLNATWSHRSKNVLDCGLKRKINPLNAPVWSVRAKIAETSEAPPGNCLKKFLSLCSSTQSDSLLSTPKNLECRIGKQEEGLMEPKVRKVSSKHHKPDDSLIPVESLNVILDFLFHDAKLKPCQHSNESTITTVEDESHYLPYKEPYFKLARPSSLISRLAICLCIVNKYHGGIGAVNQLWREFLLKMKFFLENNYEIKSLEPVEPKLDYSELLQKLQMLNSCIKGKTAGDASSSNTDIFTLGASFDEDEKRDKITNETKRIKTSGGMRRLFKEDFKKKNKERYGIAHEVLGWLASLEPSDLVFGLMPMLIHLAVTTLLKHPVCNHDFIREHLDTFRITLIAQFHSKAPQLAFSRIKILEDLIHHLTLIEQKMATAHFLFRHADHSNMKVSESDLEKYVSDLVEFKEVTINSVTEGTFPSNTKFGRLICNIFKLSMFDSDEVVQQESDSETDSDSSTDSESEKMIQVNELGSHFKEYNSILDCSETSGLYLRIRCIVQDNQLQYAGAHVSKDNLPFCFGC